MLSQKTAPNMAVKANHHKRWWNNAQIEAGLGKQSADFSHPVYQIGRKRFTVAFLVSLRAAVLWHKSLFFPGSDLLPYLKVIQRLIADPSQFSADSRHTHLNGTSVGEHFESGCKSCFFFLFLKPRSSYRVNLSTTCCSANHKHVIQ